MKKVAGTLGLLLLLSFALPALFQVVMSLIIPAIVLVCVLGLGVFLFQRRRRW